MARGRFLSKGISESEQVAELGSDTARLLFTWLIAHADVEGRLSANPRIVKGRVCPLLDIGLEDIDAMLGEMDVLGLISIYEAEGKRFLCFPSWNEHQQGIRKDREQPKYPSRTDVPQALPPVAGQLPENSRALPDNSRALPDNSPLSLSTSTSSSGSGRASEKKVVAVDDEPPAQPATTTLEKLLKAKFGEHYDSMMLELPGRRKAWPALTLERARGLVAQSQKPKDSEDSRSFRTRLKDNLDAAAGLAHNPSGGGRGPGAAELAERAAAVKAEEDALWESLSADEQAESERRAAEFLERMGLERKRMGAN
ncbi:MAG: hypothetical protein M3498_01610 [Deinococcota bacterium]|nr:hypothetical protein [Deinococcota bacterium]